MKCIGAIAACVIFFCVTNAQADYEGMIWGGILGGAAGAYLGKGHEDRHIATGAGVILGSMLGQGLVKERQQPPPRIHTRPVIIERPVVVQPQPVFVQPQYVNSLDYSGNTVADCRMLESGLRPVYACRTLRGWQILK